ncbi:activin receptor type-1-like isoform X2 [Dysidea avara]|uniref:activin receptor type-1-like isoform X2 n=1 Tax=Dysidea avara TaxID=196820 RepID=UPI003321ADBD
MWDCVTCGRTDGYDIAKCEIDVTQEHHYCSIHCDIDIYNSTTHVAFCKQQCYTTTGIPCLNFSTQNEYQLCCTTSLCNNITNPPVPTIILTTTTATPTTAPTPTSTVGATSSDDSSSSQHIIIAVCVVVVILVAGVVVGLIILKWIGRRNRRSTQLIQNGGPSHHNDRISVSPDFDDGTMTSGSGSGVPRMVQVTIARQIVLGELIGTGRYGQVYVGDYRDDLVAVKIFSTVDEESFNREKEIYNIVSIRHDNVLGYIASDMISNNGVTELWLITQYHPLGSLYDYLSVEDPSNILSPARMISLALSICNGLQHLHTEFLGVQGKPAIAHRDLKSKNILVKTHYTCCLADFGLAAQMDSKTRAINMPPTYRHGTVRYLAPEILNGTIDLTVFESFINVDIYCLGLVLWELCLRTGEGQVDEYQVPFCNMVPHDPSFEEMKKVVGVDGQRPPIPSRWGNCDVLKSMESLIKECWYQDSNARLTAARIKRRLRKLAQDLKIDPQINAQII